MEPAKFEDFEIDYSKSVKPHRLGELFMANNKKTKENVRVLKVNKNQVKPEEMIRFENWKILNVMLEHFNPEIPVDFMLNIIHFHEDDNYCYVIHENMGNTTIETILIDRTGSGGFDEATTIRILYEVMRSLDVIKNFGLAHYGVFAENIFEKNGVVKLGLPNFRGYKHGVLIRGQKKPVLAPDDNTSIKSDLWSIGVLLIDLMKGRLQLEDQGDGTFKEVEQLIYPSAEARDVLDKLVRVDQKRRMNLKELQAHPLFSELRPQAYQLNAKRDDKGFPICKMNLFTLKPGKENFVLCLYVKNAEAADRKSDYDEIYTGYLDGTIVLNKIYDDSTISVKEVWKDEHPISDIKFDSKDRLWFTLTNGEIYMLEERIGSKIASKASGFFGRTMIMNEDRTEIYFRSSNELHLINCASDSTPYSRKVVSFTADEQQLEVKDVVIDFESKIAYALTSDGAIIGKSTVKAKNKEPVDFILVKDNSRWTQIKFFAAKKKTKTFNAMTLSRNGKFLLVNDTAKVPGGIKNTISVYKLDKQGKEKPEFLTKAELVTAWSGELDYFNHMDMKVTINGDYVIMGITMCTGLLYGFILKQGRLFNILKRIKIHKHLVNSFQCYNGIYFSCSCDFTLNKLYLK